MTQIYWSRTNYGHFFLVFVRLFLCSPIHPFKRLILLNVTNRLGRKYKYFLCTCSYKVVKFLIFVNELGGKSTNYRHLFRCGKRGNRTKALLGQKPPNNEIIILHLFYIDGDIKRYLKELIQKIKYFKNIFFHILFIVMFIYAQCK